MDRSPATASPRLSTFFANPRWGVLSRSLAAIFGGYALASMTTVFCALALPGARGQAVLTGMLLAILVAACAALWAFATRSALRAWVGILAPTLLMAGASRLLGAWA
ncbi:DUF3649 domain-containing protein [Stenotrophomonas lactitubi]|uniref:DUF3649 domain-containing protein n=1 Tax=Stenotrophomonas lactitubi TaxID=2045214 RepID=UPI001DCD98AA|nr:DUF3649 domain-containing protein [Stenotrophomonas lactitubi]CAH0148481.1 hypothetical protein SRABI66_00649 [Stenotrophomonas lactitubi]CAH0187886.1 hypothetical protein SRABI122_01592 [Stenotrophomonas lactitubi]CAH0211144.1 hypothetical protein SRABI102_02028 [Stenotrophomonas lactitubi]CAH0225777.1 hypothetical protein SRABI81_02555 [Stenotrophomonas lactitubi]